VFGDPVGKTDGALVPYLENVINRDSGTPVFTYEYDASAAALPSNIREVRIYLIVQSPQPDPQTGQLRKITLNGQAMRFNPSQ
jgi:hypothetical protein